MSLRSALSATVVSAATAGALGIATPAGAADIEPGVYHLVSVGTPGACLTASQEPRAMAHLGACADAGWRFTTSREGEGYDIRRVGSDACLAVSPLRIYPPHVWTDHCGAPWPHRWIIDQVGDGVVQLRSDHTEYCLTARDTGAPAVLEPCDGNPNTFWRLDRRD